jgi:hypothetical protein
MNQNYYDIIIIGSGIAGLYSAYQIKKIAPNKRFLVLEKYKEKWIGGRTSNETFYGTEVVTGAGIGRKDTNPLLINLMKELNIHYSEFLSVMNYSNLFNHVDIVKIINKLKVEYNKNPKLAENKTFKHFFIATLGEELYKKFILSAGYTDYENADVYETLYNYGMDDNKGGWTGLHIPWREMVIKLYKKIGKKHFEFSSDVQKITKIQDKPCLFKIQVSKNTLYFCNKVIVATTITGIKKLLQDSSNNPHSGKLYNQIHGQPFLRLYAKFDNKSNEIMKQYVPHYIIVPGPLQKMIPINSEKGVYMISYSDNDNALSLKNNLKNTSENRNLYCRLIEKSLGMPHNSLHIIAIKDFYWPVGTHYYEPLKNFERREEFVYEAQHPENGMLVVGEAVSRYQGWVEGALESVQSVLSKKWITHNCQ